MVSADEVDHGKDRGASGHGVEGVDVRDRITVVLGNQIKLPVVPYKASNRHWPSLQHVEGKPKEKKIF